MNREQIYRQALEEILVVADGGKKSRPPYGDLQFNVKDIAHAALAEAGGQEMTVKPATGIDGKIFYDAGMRDECARVVALVKEAISFGHMIDGVDLLRAIQSDSGKGEAESEKPLCNHIAFMPYKEALTREVRNAAIEECAKVAESCEDTVRAITGAAGITHGIAKEIRALKSTNTTGEK